MLDAHVMVDIDTSHDASLQGRFISGRIRALGTSMTSDAEDVLIQLDEPLAYSGHYAEPAIRWIVTSPCVRYERSQRVCVASAAVRVIDALSLGDVRYDRTIAIGRARFSGGLPWRSDRAAL